MTRNGALAGIIIGALTVVVWKQLTGGIFDLYEIVPAIILATISIVAVSLLGKKVDYSIHEQFDKYESGLKQFK